MNKKLFLLLLPCLCMLVGCANYEEIGYQFYDITAISKKYVVAEFDDTWRILPKWFNYERIVSDVYTATTKNGVLVKLDGCKKDKIKETEQGFWEVKEFPPITEESSDDFSFIRYKEKDETVLFVSNPMSNIQVSKEDYRKILDFKKSKKSIWFSPIPQMSFEPPEK